jgi:hypothetical protein
MSGASEAREAVRKALEASYKPVFAAGKDYAAAYQQAIAKADLVEAMAGLVDLIIAAEHLHDIAGEAIKVARGTLATTMNETGATQIASGHHLAYLTRKGAYVNIEPNAKVPAEYMRQPDPVIDRKAIKEALEAGAVVAGCSIIRPNELILGIKGKKP